MITRPGAQVPVNIHRLGHGRVTEPLLDHLRVQPGGDQRRGVEVPQVMEPGAGGQPRGLDGFPLAVPERVTLHWLPEPVRHEQLTRTRSLPLHVGGDLAEH
jgi:hypothetical protein